MSRITPANWIAVVCTLPGACAAASEEASGAGLLLLLGILGLGALTHLSERWRREATKPARAPSPITMLLQRAQQPLSR
jgi:MYXO-CTERM domain-containing protein